MPIGLDRWAFKTDSLWDKAPQTMPSNGSAAGGQWTF